MSFYKIVIKCENFGYMRFVNLTPIESLEMGIFCSRRGYTIELVNENEQFDLQGGYKYES